MARSFSPLATRCDVAPLLDTQAIPELGVRKTGRPIARGEPVGRGTAGPRKYPMRSAASLSRASRAWRAMWCRATRGGEPQRILVQISNFAAVEKCQPKIWRRQKAASALVGMNTAELASTTAPTADRIASRLVCERNWVRKRTIGQILPSEKTSNSIVPSPYAYKDRAPAKPIGSDAG